MHHKPTRQVSTVRPGFGAHSCRTTDGETCYVAAGLLGVQVLATCSTWHSLQCLSQAGSRHVAAFVADTPAQKQLASTRRVASARTRDTLPHASSMIIHLQPIAYTALRGGLAPVQASNSKDGVACTELVSGSSAGWSRQAGSVQMHFHAHSCTKSHQGRVTQPSRSAAHEAVMPTVVAAAASCSRAGRAGALSHTSQPRKGGMDQPAAVECTGAGRAAPGCRPAAAEGCVLRTATNADKASPFTGVFS